LIFTIDDDRGAVALQLAFEAACRFGRPVAFFDFDDSGLVFGREVHQTLGGERVRTLGQTSAALCLFSKIFNFHGTDRISKKPIIIWLLNGFYAISDIVIRVPSVSAWAYAVVVPRCGVVPVEGIMPTYRAYLIDSENRVQSFQPIEAESDAKALEAAKRLVDGHDVEVWLLDRKVGRLSKTA
jgi:hypothetical protein